VKVEGKSVVHRGRVLSTGWITPHMIRVTLGGAGLDRFHAGEYTDHYVKLIFPAPGAPDCDLSDIAAVRASLPRELWPRTRTYSVRRWDPSRRELAVDFLYRGDAGIAGPWAATAAPGTEIYFMGPRGGYAPDATAGWHLLAGDESALPAIAASIEALPAEAVAKAFIEVGDRADEQPVGTEAALDLVWLHRGRRPVGELLVDRVTLLSFPVGHADVFVHGEAHFVKEIRRYLRVDRGLAGQRMSVSGYWRAGELI
jgi:NADPH-dependent ferric siderophore reductase